MDRKFIVNVIISLGLFISYKAHATNFFDSGINYWPDKVKNKEGQRSKKKNKRGQEKQGQNKIKSPFGETKKKVFDWDKYLNPENEEFLRRETTHPQLLLWK